MAGHITLKLAFTGEAQLLYLISLMKATCFHLPCGTSVVNLLPPPNLSNLLPPLSHLSESASGLHHSLSITSHGIHPPWLLLSPYGPESSGRLSLVACEAALSFIPLIYFSE